MKSEILGDDMQALVLTLAKGEKVTTEAGSFMYKKGDISIDTELTGGLMGALKRALTKESLFLVVLDSKENDAELGLASPFPGHIQNIPLSNSTLICQRDAFLCSTGEIEMDIELKYGCNPHQLPACLKLPDPSPLQILNGKPSYINVMDALGAWQLSREIQIVTGKPSASSFKHTSLDSHGK